MEENKKDAPMTSEERPGSEEPSTITNYTMSHLYGQLAAHAMRLTDHKEFAYSMYLSYMSGLTYCAFRYGDKNYTLINFERVTRPATLEEAIAFCELMEEILCVRS